jgi:HAD superfamily hydrolase (TIGR01509 family)
VRGTSGKTMEAVINRFAPEADAAYVREKAYEMVHEELQKGAPKKPGLDELLAYLKEQGIPMAVASSSSLEAIGLNLTNGGVREYFSELFTGVGMANPKPAPDIFLNTAAAMGVDPAHTLVFEDSLSGVRAGVAGGFITVMVPDMLAPDDFARKNAACICKDLFEVRDLLAAGKLG